MNVDYSHNIVVDKRGQLRFDAEHTLLFMADVLVIEADSLLREEIEYNIYNVKARHASKMTILDQAREYFGMHPHFDDLQLAAEHDKADAVRIVRTKHLDEFATIGSQSPEEQARIRKHGRELSKGHY